MRTHRYDGYKLCDKNRIRKSCYRWMLKMNEYSNIIDIVAIATYKYNHIFFKIFI